MFQHASRMTAVDFVGLEIAQSGDKEWRTNATSVARSTRSPRHMGGAAGSGAPLAPETAIFGTGATPKRSRRRAVGFTLPLVIRMNPALRRDLAPLGQLDHAQQLPRCRSSPVLMLQSRSMMAMGTYIRDHRGGLP